MSYDKGPHLDWWQSLPAADRFKYMRECQVTQVTNKTIFRMHKKAAP